MSAKPEADIEKDVRTVKIYNGAELVAQTNFMLTSSQWYLIKPSKESQVVVGTSIVLDQKTDIDNIVVEWGDNIEYSREIISKKQKRKAEAFE